MSDPTTGASGEDLGALFDADNYLYFNEDNFLSDARTEQEVAFVRTKLGVDTSTTLLDLACGHGRHALSHPLI